jgi:hypothetical protein
MTLILETFLLSLTHNLDFDTNLFNKKLDTKFQYLNLDDLNLGNEILFKYRCKKYKLDIAKKKSKSNL